MTTTHHTHDGLPIVREINGWKVVDGRDCDGPQHDTPEAAAKWWLEHDSIGEPWQSEMDEV